MTQSCGALYNGGRPEVLSNDVVQSCGTEGWIQAGSIDVSPTMYGRFSVLTMSE